MFGDSGAHGRRGGKRTGNGPEMGRVVRQVHARSQLAGKAETEEQISARAATVHARAGRLGGAPMRRAWDSLPAWAKRPDFVLVLVAGALLRLLWLDSTSFLSDQAQLLALARTALTSAALPLTGIRSSLGSMNPPASIYLLLPFAWLDPYWAVLATALANVGAVVLLYRIADRYAGRAVALAAGLLYATAWAPVAYSRFLWQQNLLAPVLLLFFWTLCRGVVEGRRGWLGWNLALWGIAVQLHPTAAALLVLPVAGVLLARATVKLRDLLVAALALGVLFLPSALWELLTNGIDVAPLRSSTSGAFHVDAMAIQQLLALLQPATRDSLGSGSLYAATYGPLGALALLMALLAVVSTLWLAAVVLRPLVVFGVPAFRSLVAQLGASRYQEKSSEATSRTSWRPLFEPLAAALAEPWWRFRALLALWELAPLALMLRHSAPVYPHYVLLTLPAAFLAVGVFLVWLARRAAALISARLSPAAHPAARRLAGVSIRTSIRTSIRPSALLVGVVLVLALAQTYGTATYVLSIERGAFDASEHGAHYGLPLDAQRAALLAASRVARSQGADLAVATRDAYQEPLEYLAATGNGPASVYDSAACLVVPAAGSRPLVTLTIAPGAASDLLPRLHGATALAGPAVEEGINSALVRIPPGATLSGERILLDAASSAAASQGPQASPRVAGYLVDPAVGGGERLLLHWTGAPSLPGGRLFDGAGPMPGSAPVAHYWFTAEPLDAAGNPLSAALWAQCPRLAWGAGQDVYASVVVPASLAANVAAWRVAAFGTPYVVRTPSLGPVPVSSGDVHEIVGVPLSREAIIPGR